jgi:hypothetical protein
LTNVDHSNNNNIQLFFDGYRKKKNPNPPTASTSREKGVGPVEPVFSPHHFALRCTSSLFFCAFFTDFLKNISVTIRHLFPDAISNVGGSEEEEEVGENSIAAHHHHLVLERNIHCNPSFFFFLY